MLVVGGGGDGDGALMWKEYHFTMKEGAKKILTLQNTRDSFSILLNNFYPPVSFPLQKNMFFTVLLLVITKSGDNIYS